jgi:hypothetical protein
VSPVISCFIARSGMDNRRRQWFPAYVYFMSDRNGAAIKAKFGFPGLVVWLAFLAACKRGHHQGQFTYGDELDGWMQLGLNDLRPDADFTLKQFFNLTGRHHQTKRRRASGDLTTIECCGWDAWNTSAERDLDANKKRRKKAQNTGEDTPTIRREYPDNTGDLQESDKDKDKDSDNGSPRTITTDRQAATDFSVAVELELARISQIATGVDSGSLRVWRSVVRKNKMTEGEIADVRSRSRGQPAEWVTKTLQGKVADRAA